ncbi:MAG TPA: hypothetical protein VK163_06110 [Opitutaceae bacterium]|nr:hypothetical protein [Opitutaceae bacterium]
MNGRTFALVFVAFTGAPLLAAAAIIVCPSLPVAVGACLAMAALGMIGAGISLALIGKESAS